MQNDLNENLLRHMILNSLRMHNLKLKQEYGQIYIACDHRSWRKSAYPQYKAARSKNRERSDLDWDEIFSWVGKIKQELDEFSPYRVIHVEQAEADDIIAVLVETTQEFGKCEPVKIVSNDKDFLQLQKYSNVSQYAPVLKRTLTEKDPRRYLFEHIVRGDAGDGVPNIFSDDDVFITEGKRQSPVSKKKLEALYQSWLQGDIQFEKIEHKRNFQRNQKMVDLGQIPDDVRERILDRFNEVNTLPTPSSTTFMTYLIKNRCKQLVANLTEFY